MFSCVGLSSAWIGSYEEVGYFKRLWLHIWAFLWLASLSQTGLYSTDISNIRGSFPTGANHAKITSSHGMARHLKPPQNIRWFERSLVQRSLLVSLLPLWRWSGPLRATWIAVWASVFCAFSISIVSLSSANSDSWREKMSERDTEGDIFCGVIQNYIIIIILWST